MVGCPRCGSIDIHHTEIPDLCQCNVCNRIFWGRMTTNTDVDPTEFLEKLCSHSPTTEVWFNLWKSGGAHRYTDIRRDLGISRHHLGIALQDLMTDGLLMKRGPKYQAVCPTWLKEEQ